ncbi:unnamed protein product [Mytilus coruscus]|uniref:HAT C-terminal dimerisation domain-containing protein n=1 Tax=Mytilus coruscus TaxID=42192 RepID=A0A6J8DMA3_MYTCO|nr:unnamed protein product [Mytilus coruscus]
MSTKYSLNGQLRNESGSLMFQFLAEFMFGISCIPHSSSHCERVFSVVRKNRTDQRATLGDKTLETLLVIKSRQGHPCDLNRKHSNAILDQLKIRRIIIPHIVQIAAKEHRTQTSFNRYIPPQLPMSNEAEKCYHSNSHLLQENFIKAKAKKLPSFHPLIASGNENDNGREYYGSGLNCAHLKLIYVRKGEDGLIDVLMSKSACGKPRVSNDKN